MRTTILIVLLSVLLLFGCTGTQQQAGNQQTTGNTTTPGQPQINENDITPQGENNDGDLISQEQLPPPPENETGVVAPAQATPLSINDSDLGISGEGNDSDLISGEDIPEAPG